MMTDEPEAQGRSVIQLIQQRSVVALGTFIIATLAVFALIFVHKVQYGAVSHVMLVNDTAGRDPSAEGVDMATIATGSTVLLAVRQTLGLSQSIGDLRKAVTARVAPQSSLMTIAVKSDNPDLAIAIDNTISDTFANTYSQLAASRYNEVLRRLNIDVNSARERTALAERRLEKASADASYVGSQASLDASAAHLNELVENRGLAVAQLVTDRTSLEGDRVQPRKTAKIVRHEILANNAKYRETETLVGRDVAQFTTTRAGVTAAYPGIAGFNYKVESEQKALAAIRSEALNGRDAYSPSEAGQIAQAAKDEAAVQGDLAKVKSFDDQIRTLRQELNTPPGDGNSVGALRAQRDAAEAQFQALSLRLTSAQANSAEASSLGNVVIVDRATDARPTILGPILLFALGIGAAAILAIVAAYVAEALVPRLIGPGDVESVYGRPMLASLRGR